MTKWEAGGADHPSGSRNIHKASLKGQAVGAIEGLRIDLRRAVRARYPNGCTTDKPMPSGYMCQVTPALLLERCLSVACDDVAFDANLRP